MNMEFRKIDYIPIKTTSMKESEVTTYLSPENIVLFQEKKDGLNSTKRFDFGRFCFLRKEYKHKQNLTSGKLEIRVDPLSLLPDRRNLIRQTISYIRESYGTESTIIDKASKLISFFLFLEREVKDDEWPSTECKALSCYRKYVEHLIIRSRLPKTSKNSISTNGAASYGKIARELIEFTYGFSRQEIERKIPSIPFENKILHISQKSKIERHEFIKTCLSIFEQFHESILDSKPLPWKIDLSNTGYNRAFIWGGRSSIKSIFDRYFYGDNGQMVSINDFIESLNSLGYNKPSDIVKIDGFGNGNRSNAIRWFKNRQERWIEINRNKNIYDGMMYTSWEIAVQCFWYCFIAATGLNYSVASSLIYGSEEYIPQRGYTFPGLKVRAGNKIIYAEFKKKFEKYFKKFVELREWAVSKLNIDPPIWFFLFIDEGQCINRNGIQRIIGERRIKLDSYKKISSGTSIPLMSIFKRNNIPINVITPSELRDGVSFDLLKITNGNSIVVSHKLNNTIETVNKFYSKANKEDAYPELANYYSKVIERVKLTGKSDPDEIPIRIINDQKPDNLPIGNCENNNFFEPKKSNKFPDDAPNPDCSRSETCLFCEHFSIHVDKEGLNKLLSFRELFPLIKERTESIDHYISIFAPIEGRIEEILEYIKKKFPEKVELIEEISTDISEGNLDDFWSHHFNFLTELGYIK